MPRAHTAQSLPSESAWSPPAMDWLWSLSRCPVAPHRPHCTPSFLPCPPGACTASLGKLPLGYWSKEVPGLYYHPWGQPLTKDQWVWGMNTPALSFLGWDDSELCVLHCFLASPHGIPGLITHCSWRPSLPHPITPIPDTLNKGFTSNSLARGLLLGEPTL